MSEVRERREYEMRMVNLRVAKPETVVAVSDGDQGIAKEDSDEDEDEDEDNDNNGLRSAGLWRYEPEVEDDLLGVTSVHKVIVMNSEITTRTSPPTPPKNPQNNHHEHDDA
eukprot:9323-Rhodomonas_salina.1